MEKIIHILGASGSGVTSIGKAISKRFGHFFIDSDICYWQPTDPPFTTARPIDERQRIVAEGISKHKKCVISGSLCGWGDLFIPKFDLVLYVDLASETRIKRLVASEFETFGERIRPGGDMYQQHKDFLEWAARYDTSGLQQRSRKLHMEWLKKISCRIINIDGSLDLESILKIISRKPI